MEELKVENVEQELKEKTIPSKLDKCVDYLRSIIAYEIITDTNWNDFQQYMKSENIDNETYKQALSALDLTIQQMEELKNQKRLLCHYCDQNSIADEKQITLNDQQIEILIHAFIKGCITTNNTYIPDLVLFLINKYFERGYKLINCHWDPKLVEEEVELCKCKKQMNIIEAWEKFSCNTGYCPFEFCGKNNQEIIAEFDVDTCFQVCIGIHCGNDDDPYLLQEFSNYAGISYAWCSEGYVAEYHDGVEQMYTKIEGYEKGKVYMKVSFMADMEFGMLSLKKGTGDSKWMDTDFHIDKEKRFKIVASLYYESCVTLVSIKVKDNNDLDLYNKY